MHYIKLSFNSRRHRRTRFSDASDMNECCLKASRSVLKVNPLLLGYYQSGYQAYTTVRHSFCVSANRFVLILSYFIEYWTVCAVRLDIGEAKAIQRGGGMRPYSRSSTWSHVEVQTKAGLLRLFQDVYHYFHSVGRS